MPTAIVTIRKEPHYRRAAIESGLKRLGYAISSTAKSDAPRSRDDLLVLWNKKRGLEEEWANRWERQGGTVIVMENGYLQKVDKTIYALSVHGHNGSGWFPVHGEDRFSALGFELKPKVQRNGYWLVIGQRGIGSSLMASPPQWAEKKAHQLRAHSYGVKVRPHPGNFAPKVPLARDLDGAGEVSIWSSSAGVFALVEGIPVTHNAPHWVCTPVFSDFERARTDALHRMSHGQWTVTEIESGEPFARMKAKNWGPKWV
jgi:hypothetical protein